MSYINHMYFFVLIMIFFSLLTPKTSLAQVVSSNEKSFKEVSAVPLFITLDNQANLASKELKLIRKSAFEAVLSSSQLSLQLQAPSKKSLKNTDRNWYEVNLHIVKTGKFYTLEFSIHDYLTFTLYNYVKKEKIPYVRLQLVARKMLFKLLYGEYNLDKIKKNRIPPIKLPIKRKNIIKKPKAVELLQELNDSKFPPSLPDDIIPPPPEPNIAEKKEKDIRDVKRTKKALKISNYESQDIDLTEVSDTITPEPDTTIPWLSKSQFMTGVNYEEIRSRILVPTEENAQKFHMRFNYNVKRKGSKSYNSSYAQFQKIFSENKNLKGVDMNLGNTLYVNMLMDGFYLGPQVEYESNSFVNLGVIGEGLALFNSNIFWAGVSALKRVVIFDHNLFFYLNLRTTLAAYTTFNDGNNKFTNTGTNTETGLDIQIYKHLYLSFNFNYTELSSASVTNFDEIRRYYTAGVTLR